MKRVAYYGGSFDPVHCGHLAVAKALTSEFSLDQLVFVPAFHAPHKTRLIPTSAYDRYAMLCLSTQAESHMTVSKIEIDAPERPFTIETLSSVTSDNPNDVVFFVMGADSWMDITTWREWETVLSIANHIVVTRPGIEIGQTHVTKRIRENIIDLRSRKFNKNAICGPGESKIYLTDLVNMKVSATEIRKKIRQFDGSWKKDVTPEVANYIEKYQIYN